MYTIYNIPLGSPTLDSVITSLNSQLPGFNVTDSDGSVAPTDALIFAAYSNTRQDLYLDFSAPRLQVSCAKALGFIRGNSYALGTSLTSPGAACIVGPDTLILSLSGTNNGLPGSAVSNFQAGSTSFQSTPSILAAIPVNVSYNQRISYAGHSEDPGLQLVDQSDQRSLAEHTRPLGLLFEPVEHGLQHLPAVHVRVLSRIVWRAFQSLGGDKWASSAISHPKLERPRCI